MDWLLTTAIGAFIGFNSGMFGIGGALLATPLLRVLLGLSEINALATPLPAAIPAALSGTIVYLRKGYVRFDVAWRALIAAVPLSQVGVVLTGHTPGIWLMVITGLVLAYSAWLFIERGYRDVDREAEELGGDADASRVDARRHYAAMYLSGAIAGFVSGFLAIGGGIVLVPAFLKVLKMPTRQAVATSLFCVAGLAIPGTVGHAIARNIDWNTALWLCVGVIPFGYIGAKVASNLKTKTLERSYGFVMLAFAVYFVVQQLTVKP